MALDPDISIGTSPTATPREIAEGAQGVAVADAATGTAINPPAGGTGATAGAYDTAANRDLMIVSQTALVADVLDLKTQLNALIASLEASKIIAS